MYGLKQETTKMKMETLKPFRHQKEYYHVGDNNNQPAQFIVASFDYVCICVYIR